LQGVSRLDDRGQEPSRRAEAPLGQPAASIPRWLAALVLLALIASGVWSTWLILAPESDTERSPDAVAEGR